MERYPFDLIPPQCDKPLDDRGWAQNRPFIKKRRTLKEDASRFVAGQPLADAMNTAIAVGDPLLLTGEPGTGKTQAAYYAAWRLGAECFHFQVKSDTAAKDLLYDFDMVRYFRAAHLSNIRFSEDLADDPEKKEACVPEELDKKKYRGKGKLWQAFEKAKDDDYPQVLLIDEIDKAPRDFPNDLLHELDQMEFEVPETNEKVKAEKRHRPVVFITSNSERRLPEPFLRRCAYHHIEFADEVAFKAAKARAEDYVGLSLEFIDTAVKLFLALRDRELRKRPATGELLTWLGVLSLARGGYPDPLDDDLSRLPYLSVLLKDHKDIEETRGNK